ncbi:methyl-coenzyme M reductase operon protein D [Methanothermus fervidus DSM 2088]|uniref:Methyl-coenzyme M reductase operon protein D n=1 Tax=Methanothermus fervidus (strain ATCC 43054 / DSM 2088 / JCM 10308 / V24 S) TaxID=523846 RepID=E3GZ54_METFV|nr:methyl-coenzyme M reductase operon protein D [Methanothermus fervidus]ADP77586.1 methyl-coenzyme M reductase operon protein D [Methanothermus fervidus DSM 2088]
MDVEIFPHRLLSAETTEKLLNKLGEIEGIKRMIIQGQRLPAGEHPDRRVINVKGQDIELKVKTGRIFVEIEDKKTMEKIKEVCDEVFPFKYELIPGTFFRRQKTVTDAIKFGKDVDKLPTELVGMTDQSARLKDRVSIIPKTKKKKRD